MRIQVLLIVPSSAVHRFQCRPQISNTRLAYVNFGRESSKRFKQTTSSSSLKKMAKVKMRFDANELEELSTGTVNPAALRHKIKLRQMRLGAV